MDISMAAPLIKPLSVAGREVWKFGKQQVSNSFDRFRRRSAQKWVKSGVGDAGFHISKAAEHEMTPEQLDAFGAVY